MSEQKRTLTLIEWARMYAVKHNIDPNKAYTLTRDWVKRQILPSERPGSPSQRARKVLIRIEEKKNNPLHFKAPSEAPDGYISVQDLCTMWDCTPNTIHYRRKLDPSSLSHLQSSKINGRVWIKWPQESIKP